MYTKYNEFVEIFGTIILTYVRLLAFFRRKSGNENIYQEQQQVIFISKLIIDFEILWEHFLEDYIILYISYHAINIFARVLFHLCRQTFFGVYFNKFNVR